MPTKPDHSNLNSRGATPSTQFPRRRCWRGRCLPILLGNRPLAVFFNSINRQVVPLFPFYSLPNILLISGLLCGVGIYFQRELHSRNKKAMEFIAKGWSALKEVDRVIDYCDRNDHRLIPLLRTAKENFEMALEADNSNTHARYWLSKLHMKYHIPGANKAVGAALLVEAAEMGDPDAQYELGCRLRVENEHVQSDQQAFYYLEKAVDQLHPGALYLLGAVYLTGDCVKKDIASALWCFHRASEKGHAGAAIAYGSLLLKGAEVPESLTKFSLKRGSAAKKSGKGSESIAMDPVEMAREKFHIAAKAGCDLGFKWVERLEEEEKRLLKERRAD